MVTGSSSLQNNIQYKNTKWNHRKNPNHKKKVIKDLHIKKGWLWHLLLGIVLRQCRPKSSVLNKEGKIWLLNVCTDFWTVRKTKTCKFTKLPHVTFTYSFSEGGYCELSSQYFFISTLNLTSQTWHYLSKHLKFPSLLNSNSLIWVKISQDDGSGKDRGISVLDLG